MAGDWLKMELNTPDKPEVWQIAGELELDPDAVVGKLFRVWSWFDQHTEGGNAPTVTKKLLDRLVGVTGFCDAVIKAAWMIESDSGISLPNFERHNGKTAKTRAVTAKRVATHRNGNGDSVTKSECNGDSVTESQTCNDANVTTALAREEKRREDINLIPNGICDNSSNCSPVPVVDENFLGSENPAPEEEQGPTDQPKRVYIPYQQIVDLYHEVLPELPKVEDLGSARRGQIHAFNRDRYR